MKLNISTVLRQDDFIRGYTKGTMTIESEYGWHCPICGEYTKEFVQETFSHYNSIRERTTVINRVLTLHNDGNDWLCDDCKDLEAAQKRSRTCLLLKKFSLD